MKPADIEQTIKRIIHEKLDVSYDQILPATHLKEDLGIDSLDAVELIMEVETAFQITIADEEAERLRTVEDMIRCVEQHV